MSFLPFSKPNDWGKWSFVFRDFDVWQCSWDMSRPLHPHLHLHLGVTPRCRQRSPWPGAREALPGGLEACGASPDPELRPGRPGVSMLSVKAVTMGSGVRLAGFNSWVCHLPLMPLSFSVLILPPQSEDNTSLSEPPHGLNVTMQVKCLERCSQRRTYNSTGFYSRC